MDDFDLLLNDLLSDMQNALGQMDVYRWLNKYPNISECTSEEIHYFIARILDSDLFEKGDDGEGRSVIVKLTQYGRDVSIEGGWIAHINKLAFRKINEEKDAQLNRQKTRYEVRLTKRQTWLLWPGAVLGAFGGIHALCQLLGIIK